MYEESDVSVNGLSNFVCLKKNLYNNWFVYFFNKRILVVLTVFVFLWFSYVSRHLSSPGLFDLNNWFKSWFKTLKKSIDFIYSRLYSWFGSDLIHNNEEL